MQQRKVLRLLCNKFRTPSGKLVSCRPLFKELKILTLSSLYVFECVSFILDNMTKASCFADSHPYNTRHQSMICLPHHKSTLFQGNHFYMGAKLYNALPGKVRDLQSKAIKSWLKDLFLNHVFYTVDEFIFHCKEC